MITITNFSTGEKITIARDVCTIHPQWVHEQCGTATESELQSCLDGLNVGDWYRDGRHLGPDTAGIEMTRPAPLKRGRKPTGKTRLANLPKIRRSHHALLRDQSAAAGVSLAVRLESLIESGSGTGKKTR